MSYLNGQVGHREELLATRSVVKKENYVLLEVDGLVKNAVPGYTDCDVTILGTPAMGASFADYYVTAHAGGKSPVIGGNGIEAFAYVVEGEVVVSVEGTEEKLTEGGYIYTPEDESFSFENKSGKDAVIYLYRRRYEPYADLKAKRVVGNINDVEYVEYEGMDNCHIKDFLPAAGDFGYDMNMHILKFKPGASHGYIETHLQEHGMLFLQGKAMYRLDSDWVPVKKGDYVFMDAYCPQACYGVGDEDLVYIYSKDCNREIAL